MKKYKFVSVLIISMFSCVTLVSQTQIAVIDFSGKNVSSADASALTERLMTELFLTNKYKILERDKMEEILREQGFQLSGCTTNECFIEIGQLLNVEQLVIGSISQVGSTYSISARIINVETGEILSTATYDNEGQIDDLLKRGMKIVALKLSSNNSNSEMIQRQYDENDKMKINTAKKKTSPISHRKIKTLSKNSNEIFMSLQTNFTGNKNFASNTRDVWPIYIIGSEISKYFIFQCGLSNTIKINKTIPFEGEFINKAEINYWIADGMIKYPFILSKRLIITPSSGYLYSSIVFSSEESGKIKFINSGMINQIRLKYILSPVTISIHVSRLFFAKYDNWSGTGISFGFLF